MPILQSVNYLGPLWHERWPWYTGWCSNLTAGPDDGLCHPVGSPPSYECAVFSRGNIVTQLAGVAMQHNNTFTVQTAPGFPQGTGSCPELVVNQSFNTIDVLPDPFFGNAADQFVDYAGGDLTLRGSSAIYTAIPGFKWIPFRKMGIGGDTVPPAPAGLVPRGISFDAEGSSSLAVAQCNNTADLASLKSQRRTLKGNVQECAFKCILSGGSCMLTCVEKLKLSAGCS